MSYSLPRTTCSILHQLSTNWSSHSWVTLIPVGYPHPRTTMLNKAEPRVLTLRTDALACKSNICLSVKVDIRCCYMCPKRKDIGRLCERRWETYLILAKAGVLATYCIHPGFVNRTEYGHFCVAVCTLNCCFCDSSTESPCSCSVHGYHTSEPYFKIGNTKLKNRCL